MNAFEKYGQSDSQYPDHLAGISSDDTRALMFKDSMQMPQLSESEEIRLGQDIEKMRGAIDLLCEPVLRCTLDSEQIQDLHTVIDTGLIARQTFVLANTKLVLSIAKDFMRRAPLDVLFQEGVINLHRAAEKYNWREGRFSTYATPWIRKAMHTTIAEIGFAVPVPQNTYDNLNTIAKAFGELRQKLRRQPTMNELARHTGFTVKNVRLYLETMLPESSLNATNIYGHEPQETWSFKQTAPSAEEEAFRNIHRQELEQIVLSLPNETAMVFRLVIGWDQEPMTREEIARYLRIPESRVQQYKKAAIEYVKQALSRH